MFEIVRFAYRDLPAALHAVGTGRSAAAALAAALTIAVPETVPAASVTAKMSVSCEVIARAVVMMESSPASILVTADDVARGYAEISRAIVVRTRTNSRAGYLLEASRTSTDFIAVEVSFAGESFTVTESRVLMQRPYVPDGDHVALDLRLRLGPGSAPGTYPLPVVITASPL